MGIESYQKIDLETDISTASPLRIVQLLYAGAVRKTFEAKGAIERKDYFKKSELISGVIAIVMELERTLDVDAAGALGQNLAALYVYIREGLMEANIQNDPEKLHEVATLLMTIKEGWDAIPDNA